MPKKENLKMYNVYNTKVMYYNNNNKTCKQN